MQKQNKISEEIISQLKMSDNSLNHVLTETEVASFEKEHEISLPSDYRNFLLTVGNGGDGPPEYGLLKIRRD